MANSTSLANTGKSLSAASIGQGLKNWVIGKRMYFVAFFIPVILTYLAYLLFGLYPAGKYSVLCLDLNGQYVYFFEALRDAFWGDGSIFYDWARNLSGNYMGIIGYYLASPFTLIVMLLPEKFMLGSLLIMQLCKLGAASVTFSYFLQKRRGLSSLHSLFFSVVYSMMAYAVIQLIDPMWLDGIVFLPLIMAGVEYLIDDGRKINYAIPLAIMFVANFYIGYMIAIFTALYYFFYLFFGSDTKKKPVDYFKITGRMGIATLAGLLCALFMILPVYFALQQGKFEFTDPDYSMQFQFDLIDLIPQLLPAQYDSVNVDGSPEIYSGILTVILLPLFYANGKINFKKKIGYTLLLLCMVFSMYIKPIDMMWHGGQVPNWLPFRYSFLVSFVLITMAATAFSKLKDIKVGVLGAVFFGMMVLLLVISKLGYEHIDTVKSIWVSIALVGIYLIILYFLRGNMHDGAKRFGNVLLSVIMLVAIGAEATYNATDSMKKIHKEVAYSTRDSWGSFVQSGRDTVDMLEEYDDGLYRSEKTYYRCVNDNGAFGLRGISHSSSVMNTRIINFIETMGYCTHSYYTRYNGNTPIADSLLGIKYILNKETETGRYLNSTYQPVEGLKHDYVDESNKEHTIQVYENPNALSIGYMVNDDITSIGHLGNDNPFNSQNIFLSTITGNTEFSEDGSAFLGNREYYTPIQLNGDPILNNVTTSPYGDQTCYTAESTGDPTVTFCLTAPDDKPIYIYFRTDNQKSVNLWLDSNESTGWFNDEGSTENDAEFFSAYFEGDNYTIMKLGEFEPGQNIRLRMTVANEYTIVRNFFFYSFNDELFQQDIDTLKNNQWQIEDGWKDNKIKGTITAEEGQIMLTSIPWEDGYTEEIRNAAGKKYSKFMDTIIGDGWRIKVDGKRVEPVKVLDAFVGVKLEPGEHTVELKYTPPGWTFGVIAFVFGVAALVLFFMYDKKNNKVLIAIAREKKMGVSEQKPKVKKLSSEDKVAELKKNSALKSDVKDEKDKKAEDKQKPKQKTSDSDNFEEDSKEKSEDNNSDE